MGAAGWVRVREVPTQSATAAGKAIAKTTNTRNTFPLNGDGFDLGLLTAADSYQRGRGLWTKDLR